MRFLLVAALSACAVLAACADEDLTVAPPKPERGSPASAPTIEVAPPLALTIEPSSPSSIEGRAWAAIVHPRRDVFEVSADQVRAILAGRIDDWRDLGGVSGPIEVHVADAETTDLALAGFEGAARAIREPEHAVIEAVRSNPGAIGVVRVEALTPDVLPLVIDGWDPLGMPASRSPLRTTEEPASFDPVSVLALGELIPARCVDAALAATGNYDLMFEGVRTLIERADVTLTSLDASLSDCGPRTPCVSTFELQGSARAAEAMGRAGIDVAVVNGNHVFNCWRPCPSYAGLRDTLANLRTAGVAPVAAGENAEEARRPHIIEVGTKRIAFLGYDSIAPGNWATEARPGTAALRREQVLADVAAARANADLVVVGLGWGDEYEFTPNAAQRDLGRAVIEAGADLVVGNHPHVHQATEVLSSDRGSALVAYALGNFIFDQTWSDATMQSLVLEAGFLDGRLIGYRVRPVSNRGAAGQWPVSPRVLEPSSPEGRFILERMWAVQDSLR